MTRACYRLGSSIFIAVQEDGPSQVAGLELVADAPRGAISLKWRGNVFLPGAAEAGGGRQTLAPIEPTDVVSKLIELIP